MLQSHYKKKLCLYFGVLATLPSIIFPTEGQRIFGMRRLFPILNLLDFCNYFVIISILLVPIFK